MMRYNYGCVLKFIIPHFKDDGGIVVAYDYQIFKRDLYAGFKALGLEYFFSIPIKEIIDGFEYDAEILVVYCHEVLEKVFIEEFRENCRKCHKEFGIKSFNYTQNGIFVNFEIGDDS